MLSAFFLRNALFGFVLTIFPFIKEGDLFFDPVGRADNMIPAQLPAVFGGVLLVDRVRIIDIPLEDWKKFMK